MPSVRIALAVGLGLTAAAIGATLSGSPPSVAATNGISGETTIGTTRQSVSACQAGEVLPAGASAIRLAFVAEIGPPVTVTALSGKRVLAHGTRGAGWSGGVVTVPIRPRVSRTTPGVTVCFALGPTVEPLRISGENAPAALALSTPSGERLPGRMRVEYLRPGSASWASLLPSVARRMGLGHAWDGTWIVFALLGAMASGATLASWLVLRELG
jgi:hypothetical protein